PVRKILPYSELASVLNININKVLEVAHFLKTIGYEVRNHNTNSRILCDHLLIPYLFPTLTNLSVQLRKKL
ncbi:hypothetical protein, partial [Leptospira yasudae]|uniref:hypothetical protein n=1 Tax=Leptospira yasudae TaxID=2202201 RepID=UPI001082991B